MFAGYRFPAEIDARVRWLFFRFPLSQRMVDQMLAGRNISIN
jgi:transposase-like protein